MTQTIKNIFWLSILFSLTIFRWFIYLKKIFLWPFKLGIFSFFYSLFGIDFSWFLGLFYFFYVNIPHWVYIQYLTLYNNWLNWWHSTVNIKNLNTIPLPERLDKSKNLELGEPVDSNLDESDNKISKNKKIILITLTIIAIVGLGIWYYYYSDVGGTGRGGNNLPPQDPSQNPVHPIEIFDRQTGLAVNTENLNDTQRLSLVDRADRLRDLGRISNVEHQQLLNSILPPAPSYEGSVNIPAIESSSSASSSTNNPVITDNTTASASESTVTNQTDVPAIVVQPATPIEGSSQPQMGDIARPSSPAGSDDSSETIRNYSYGDPADRRYAFPRRSFDPSYRRDN